MRLLGILPSAMHNLAGVDLERLAAADFGPTGRRTPIRVCVEEPEEEEWRTRSASAPLEDAPPAGVSTQRFRRSADEEACPKEPSPSEPYRLTAMQRSTSFGA